MKDEWLLTPEEIKQCYRNTKFPTPNAVEKQIAKAQAEKIAPLIAKAEWERIKGLLNMRDVGGINPEWAMSDKNYQFLSGERE